MILRLADPIVHQRQPTDRCCLATCFAMALGIPVEELGINLEQDFEPEQFGPWLAERGIWLRIGDRGEPLTSGLYVLGVISLNDKGGEHAILLDGRAGATKVFDPNAGNPGKEHYSSTILLESNMIDFCELVARRPDTAGAPPADDLDSRLDGIQAEVESLLKLMETI